MEAGVVALSHCARELIPIMQMDKFLGPAVGLSVDIASMHFSIHEDNAGALVLADTLPPQHTPQQTLSYQVNLVQGID